MIQIISIWASVYSAINLRRVWFVLERSQFIKSSHLPAGTFANIRSRKTWMNIIKKIMTYWPQRSWWKTIIKWKYNSIKSSKYFLASLVPKDYQNFKKINIACESYWIRSTKCNHFSTINVEKISGNPYFYFIIYQYNPTWIKILTKIILLVWFIYLVTENS